MICEKCGKEFFEDWRKDKRNKCRFCSISCAKFRKHSETTKEKIKFSVKKDYEQKGNNYKRKTNRNFTEEERKKGYLKQKEEAEIRNNSFFKENKYEKIPFKCLRKLLLEDKNNKCEICGNSEWLNKKIWLEVHHIDDNNKNNKKENLIIVCPNCHSVLDENYRFKGRKHRSMREPSEAVSLIN